MKWFRLLIKKRQLDNIFSFCRMKAYEKTSDTRVVKKLIEALKPYFEARSIQVREDERKKIIVDTAVTVVSFIKGNSFSQSSSNHFINR